MTSAHRWPRKPPRPQGNDVPLGALTFQEFYDRMGALCDLDMPWRTARALAAAFEDLRATHRDPLRATAAELVERITYHQAAEAATDRSTT